jgi:hypothetical protein
MVSLYTTFLGLIGGIILDIKDLKAYMEMKGYLCPSGSLCDPTPDCHDRPGNENHSTCH